MTLLALLPALLAAFQTLAPGGYRMTLPVPGASEPMPVALIVPRGYDGTEPRPLVLALHPGGTRFPFYGGAFMDQVVAPGLYDLDPIIVAPDCPTQSWSDPVSEEAVLTLMKRVMAEFNVDPQRVLVTGFSMGGRGAWFMSARHTDLFTAAIVMAGSMGGQPLDTLGAIPTYVIHSRDDEVVPFGPAERGVRDLERQGRTVRFQALDGPGHFDMNEYVEPLRRAADWIADRWND